ncbi:TRAP transporter small permease [Meridianimarinicoccus roseus]|jgi:TRAP-type C4-dicarboxylate transport system permease small subunit|uniref:TRAP transporter small permease protein n=1 Tax=Meridianimarinicoccus roseus TaxID=2072018 RepID=A0A2V2LQW3_9RHOB|nr:TRAP transporter small permease [Meridianimarinicoccus roseus]PWR04599.1 TRAP transporter small permease [Meridianimarinicoccus roseus]
MHRFEPAIAVVDRWLGVLLDAMVVGLAGLLLLLLNWAVFARFILNDSVSWGEELPAHLLAMLTFIGAAYLTRTNEHLGFDAVLRVMPDRAKRVVTALNLALMGIFGGLLAWYGGIAAASFGDRSLISVDAPMMLFRAAMPLGGALIAMFCAVRLVGILSGRIDPMDLLPESDA